jgi:hypothetical protein
MKVSTVRVRVTSKPPTLHNAGKTASLGFPGDLNFVAFLEDGNRYHIANFNFRFWWDLEFRKEPTRFHARFLKVPQHRLIDFPFRDFLKAQLDSRVTVFLYCPALDDVAGSSLNNCDRYRLSVLVKDGCHPNFSSQDSSDDGCSRAHSSITPFAAGTSQLDFNIDAAWQIEAP